MRLIIRPTPDAASLHVARYIQSRINAFAPSAARPFVLGLPTGSSPEAVYRYLISFHRAGELSFAHVVTFNMDEYVGLPAAHAQSYHSFMWTHFFAHVDIQPQNVHLLNGLAPDLAAECARYEARIKELGGIDLFLGGVGPDGHVAFNEPGSSLTSCTRVKTLAQDTITANARFFGGREEDVPRMALTVGVGTVMDAREVVIIATGANKAWAIREAVEGAVSHMVTLSALQTHPTSMIVVDEDATSEMKVKTVKYFKQIEEVADKVIEAANLKAKL